MSVRYNELTREEEKVIIKKGTEAPFTGEYDDHFEKGSYLCRRYNSFLHESESKFNAGCDWSSFDSKINQFRCVNSGGKLDKVILVHS